MPVVNFERWSSEPVVCIIDALEHLVSYNMYPGSELLSIELTTFLGYKATKLVLETESETAIYHYVYSGAASDEVIPARFLLKYPRITFQWIEYFGGDTYFASWPALKAAWQAVAVTWMALLLDYYSNGSCGEPTYHEIAYAGGTQTQRTAIIPVFTDSEILVYQMGLWGMADGGDAVNKQMFQVEPATPGAGTSVTLGDAALEKIAQALTDISRASRITWINGSAGFADIATGDTVTEGGGSEG